MCQSQSACVLRVVLLPLSIKELASIIPNVFGNVDQSRVTLHVDKQGQSLAVVFDSCSMKCRKRWFIGQH